MLKVAQLVSGVDSTLLDLESARNGGDPGLIPGLGRSPREGNDCPLQGSCLENSMDRGAWHATVHGVTKSQTRLRDLTLSQFHVLCIQDIPNFILFFYISRLCSSSVSFFQIVTNLPKFFQFVF